MVEATACVDELRSLRVGSYFGRVTIVWKLVEHPITNAFDRRKRILCYQPGDRVNSHGEDEQRPSK